MTTTLILPNKNEPAKDRIVSLSKPYVDEIIVVNDRLYGEAYKEGFRKAKGDIIIGFDCDGSYNPHDIPKFIEEMKTYDFVLGNRFDNPDKDSMPKLNFYGNKIIRGLLRLRGVKYQEVCTGFFSIRKDKIPYCKNDGFEFSSEFLIKTKDLKCKEIPIRFHQREGESKLKPFKDGWKHFKILIRQI